MATLYIDPTDAAAIKLNYEDGQLVLSHPKGNEILPAMLNITDQQLPDTIALVNQSDSFTMIRVLATILNTLAYSRSIKLMSDRQPVARIIPHYSQSPRITPAIYVEA